MVVSHERMNGIWVIQNTEARKITNCILTDKYGNCTKVKWDIWLKLEPGFANCIRSRTRIGFLWILMENIQYFMTFQSLVEIL